jgi:hypothetical protein
LARKIHTDRRTLSQIPGAYVAAAAEGLPPCSPEATPQMREVDTGLWGRFKVTFKPVRHSGPTKLAPRWVWIPVDAERLA